MATEPTSDDFHIGKTPHTGRNLGIVGGIVALGGLAAVFLISGDRSDDKKMEKLTAFTTIYATKCDERVAGPPASMLKDMYLGSTKIQEAVEAQRLALESGTPCAKVYTVLRAADLPLPRLN
jgi:hypothetical protein